MKGPNAQQDGPGRRDPRDIAQLDTHPVSLRRIAGLFRPYRFSLILVMILIAAASAVGLATPFLTRQVIDQAIPQQNVQLLVLLVAAMVGVSIVSSILGVIQTWMSTTIGQRVMHRLRTDVFSHLQRQSLDFFTRTRGGEVQSRLINDVGAMQNVVTNTATSMASNVTAVVGTAIAMAALSWRLSLLSLIVLPPSIWVTRRVARMRREVTNQRQRAMSGLHSQVEESLSISGILLGKTMGAGPALSDRFEQASHGLLGLEVAAQLAGRWRMATMSIVFAAIPALLYLLGGNPATSGGMSIGTLVAFTALQAGLFRPLMGVLNVGVQVTSSLALFSRIFEYLDLPVDIADPEHPVAMDPHATRGQISFDDVSFRYRDADRDALSHVTLEVPAGTSLALVGHTGSGKSTLAALVSRLHDPTAGRVTIDGIDLRDLSLQTLASLVGVVSQDTYLLHASIADNLRFAKADATDAELIDACRAAQIHDQIMVLPGGYDTVVGARGHRFSGGEKQRLAIARTLLRDPRVLVLDEATSALDNTTERAVQQALSAASRGRTTITIAHRLSTIADADQTAVLSGGQVVELGDHHALLLRDGAYADLIRHGSQSEAPPESPSSPEPSEPPLPGGLFPKVSQMSLQSGHTGNR